MKGKHGTSMQGIEYAPKKKGNVLCRNCEHLAFRTTGNSKTKDVKCNHYCSIKKRPTWYTAQCYCRHYTEKTSTEQATDTKIIIALQCRAEQVQEEKRQRKLSRKGHKKVAQQNEQQTKRENR